MDSIYTIPCFEKEKLKHYIYNNYKKMNKPTSWFYGVVVSTLDFESSDLGSTPGRTSF